MKRIKKQLCLLLAVVMSVIAFGSFSHTSYAAKGDLGEGYQAANMDAEYTTVDGQKISSRSEGVVTILLFARTNGNCSNSTAAISSLCGSSWIRRDDVRLIVVDIDCASAETVKAMQTQKGSDAAIFCYDETSAASGSMWSYLRSTMGQTLGVTLPVTIIIDGNDKVQYCRTGYVSQSTVLPYVAELAGWQEQDIDDGLVDVYVEGTFDAKEAFQVLELVNQARAEQGLSALKMDAVLMDQAMQRAAECAVYYSHTRPNGETCFSILTNQYRGAAAENIAAGYTNASKVTEGWLNSPGHYANIMGENFTSIGIGCFYQNGTPYWVQLFSSYCGTEAVQKENTVKKATVKAAEERLGRFSLRYSSAQLQVGQTAAPVLGLVNLGFGSSVPSNDTIAFQTSDADVARVDKDGTLHAVSAGNAVITAVLDGVLTAEYSIQVTAGQTQPPAEPSEKPQNTSQPTARPSEKPQDTSQPTSRPSAEPQISNEPTGKPSQEPQISNEPAGKPSQEPQISNEPTYKPSSQPQVSNNPTGKPSQEPQISNEPTGKPSQEPQISNQPSQKPGKLILGDLNFDMAIDLTDAQMALKAALRIITLNDGQKETADIDGDGVITLSDAQRVLRAALKIETFHNLAD